MAEPTARGNRSTARRQIVLCAQIASILLSLTGVLLLIHRPLFCVFPEPGYLWVFIPYLKLQHIPLLALFLAILSVLVVSGGQAGPRWSLRLLLATAPWVVGLLWLGALLPTRVWALTTFYGPVLWLVLLAFDLVSRLKARPARTTPPGRLGLLVFFLASSTFYTMTGVYYTTHGGEHAGDEGYYLLQVESLHRDGDTDLANNLDPDAADRPGYLREIHRFPHISEFSRKPHLYTWHEPGLPFLLYVVTGGGLWGRHVLLGLMAGLGLTAVLGICRSLGLPRGSSLLVVLLHGLSVFWVVYSSRCLPEVLGSMLVCVTFWAALRQDERPWTSAWVAAACIAYMPLAHLRFLPVALGCAGFYALLAVLDRRPWRGKLGPLAVWALLMLAGLALGQAYQFSRFEGGLSLPAGDVLMHAPAGAWHALASTRSITNYYPLVLWLLPANLLWAIRSSAPQRWYALTALGLFFGVLLTAFTGPYWHGGSTMGGRYFVVAVATLLPGAAWAWPRCAPAARWSLLMLAGISVGLTLWQLVFLPELGGNFAFPWYELKEVVPALVGLQGFMTNDGFLFASLFLGVCALVFWPKERAGSAWLIAALTVACFAYLQSGARFVPDGPLYKDFKTGPQATAKLLQARKLERYADSVRHDDRTPSIFEVADLFYEPRKPTNLVSIATSAHMELPPGAIDLSALEANDGPGRDLRWGLLRKLPAGARGESRLWLEGRVVGNVRAVLGVMAGTNTLLETALQPGPQGEVAQTFTLRSPDHREVRIRMRLEGGEGAFWGRRIAWSPYSSRLFPAAGLTVPGEAVSSN